VFLKSRAALLVSLVCVWHLTACAPMTQAAPQPMEKTMANANADVKTGFKSHAATAQLYRWYQYYENSAIGINNQLDILDPLVSVKSGLGEVKGHDAYRSRVDALPNSWKNAHFVRSAVFSLADDGSQRLKAGITYLNQGMKPDGSVRTAELTYETVLKPGLTVLPKFEKIAITQHSEGQVGEFKPAYGDNRLLSLVHYWLAIIEDPARNPEPAREVLADKFSLNFSSGAVTDFNGFKAWLAGPGSQVTASTHVISNFSQEKTADNQYRLSVDFDWEGILPNGQSMTAKTRHRWAVQDNPTERFARIKSVDVEVLNPFAPKATN
jgi:hypothetical protein